MATEEHSIGYEDGKSAGFDECMAQQRTWVGLTDEEWSVICEKNNMLPDFDLKEEIEAKLKEKNT